jgi:hypothetical protein
MLNGSNDKAIATLNQLGDVKDGWVYYLKAIANARGGVMDGVATNLRQAITLDPAIKAYALKDAELLKASATDAVKALLQ